MTSRRRVRRLAVLVAVSIGGVAACGDGSKADAEEFCSEVDANKAQLTKPKLRSERHVAAYVELYRDIGELAPLAIEEEWGDLTSNWETAATVDPGDENSVLRARSKAYATERSAVAVRDWLRSNCGVALGPVTTIVAHRDRTAPAPTTTTTITVAG